jgi:hypothetical protein
MATFRSSCFALAVLRRRRAGRPAFSPPRQACLAAGGQVAVAVTVAAFADCVMPSNGGAAPVVSWARVGNVSEENSIRSCRA